MKNKKNRITVSFILIIAVVVLISLISIGIGKFLSKSKGAVFPYKVTEIETICREPEKGHSDVKFIKGKLLNTERGTLTSIMNLDGSEYRTYPELDAYWTYVLEDGENLLIAYTNEKQELGLVCMDSDYRIQWNRILFTMGNLTIDPAIVKTSQGYLLTATEIFGTVNNADPNVENGTYSVHSWFSTDLEEWNRLGDILNEQNDLEDIDLLEKDGIVYLVYEKEELDKGNSAIQLVTSSDSGASWSQPVELLAADSDHEPAAFMWEGDQFLLYYSSDQENPGQSYMGGKAYYAVFDRDLNCKSKDNELKNLAQGGILLYDISLEDDSSGMILYAEDYLTTGSLVVEKSR